MTSTYDSWLAAQAPPAADTSTSAAVLWFEDQPVSRDELERIKEIAEVLPAHALWDQGVADDLEYQAEALAPVLAGDT